MALDNASSWKYYKKLTIQDSGNASADYQIKLTVYAGSGTDDPNNGIVYCDNHCENFPNDIRFGTTNNPKTAEQLPQWIEEYDDNSATIWIKLPSDGSDTIYMFVGNPSASFYSDGDAVFIFFDDFLGSELDTDKWVWYNSADLDTKEVSNSLCHFAHDSSGKSAGIKTVDTFAVTDRIIETKYRRVQGSHYAPELKITSPSAWAALYYAVEYDEWDAETEDSGGETVYVVFCDTNFRIGQIIIKSSTSYFYLYDTDDNLLGDATLSQSDWSDSNILVTATSSGDTEEVEVDWVRIRKYADTEPTWDSFSDWKQFIGTGWQWVKELNISDTNDVSADYQMRLQVYAGEGTDDSDNGIIYCDNHCENFPDDIRFGTTDDPSTAEQLAQWIESHTESGLDDISYDSTIFGHASQGVAMDDDYFYGIAGVGILVTKISDGKSIKAGFQYDSSEDAYEDYTDEINDWSTNDVELLPSTPAVGDAFYFGLYNKFTALLIRIEDGYQGSDITITWKYWNGNNWVALSNVTDETNSFTTSGWGWVYWDRPSDWEQCTVNGVTAYWIKAEVTSVGASPTQPKATAAASGRYCADDGDYTTHLTDGHVLSHGGENFLYVAGCNYPDTPKTGGVYKYKLASDSSNPLDFVALVKDFSTESCPGYLTGVDKYEVDGTTYWWVIWDVANASSSNPSEIWRYDYDSDDDTNWTNKTVYELGYYHTGYNIQGFTWWEDDYGGKYIICPIHEGSSPETIDIYKWNGNGFDNYAQYDVIQNPDGDKSTQGVCRDYSGDNTYLYFASRQGPYGSPILKGETSQITEHAIIWVKLPSDGSDTIYMFVGNDSADEYSENPSDFFYWYDDFSGNYHTLDDYTVVDHGDNNTPSDWEMNTSKQKIVQHSNIWDSGDGFGSALLTGLNVDNYRIFIRIKEVDDDEIGILFSYQSETQYYSFMFENQSTPHWALGKDVFRHTASSWLASTNTPIPSRTMIYEFKILKAGSTLKVYRNDDGAWTEILSATDSSYGDGDIGLATCGCDEGEFHAKFIVAKGGDPEPTWSSFGEWTQLSTTVGSGWQWVKQLNISDPNNVSADYQMQLTVYAGEGDDDPENGIVYCDNHCENFPNDIRFGTTDDPDTAEQLPQWIETYDSSMAIIWVKLPSDGSDTIYMFVGNSDASMYSDGEATFIFFDDFDTLSGWQEYDPDDAGTISAEDSQLHITVSGTGSSGHTAGAETTNTVASMDGSLLVAKAKGEKLSNTWNIPWNLQAIKDNDNEFQNRYREAKKYQYVDEIGGEASTYQYCSTSYTQLEWRIVYIKMLQSWRKAGAFTDYYNGNRVGSEVTDTTTGITDNFKIRLLARSFESNLDSYYDWVFVAKFSDTPPEWSSFGSWTEITTVPTKSYKFDTIIFQALTKSYDFDTKLKEIAKRSYKFYAHVGAVYKEQSYGITTALIFAPYNLKIYHPSYSADVWCLRWDEGNWSIILELLASRDARNTILENITPGAVSELYNILGQPKYIDTTFSSGNTFWLVPRRYLQNLRETTKVACKSYSDTLLRNGMFHIKMECVKL